MSREIARGAALAAFATVLASGVAAAPAKFSYPVAAESTMGQSVDRFAELVKDKTGGAVTVQGFPGAQLGNEIQSQQAAQGGTIEFSVTTTAALAALVPEFNLFNLPFAFSSYDQLDAVSRGETSKQVLAKLEPANLVGLCYWDYGFRNITNSKRPVTTLEDVSGLRVRTIQNAVYIDALKAMGMSPQPLPFPETFTALETGAIDGVEIANDVTKSSSFHEVQKYITETKHFHTLSVVLASKKFWDAQTPEHQEAIRAACAEASDFNREIVAKADTEALAFLQEHGMERSEIAPEALQAFRDAVKPVVDQVSGTIEPALRDAFMAEVEAAAPKAN